MDVSIQFSKNRGRPRGVGVPTLESRSAYRFRLFERDRRRLARKGNGSRVRGRCKGPGDRIRARRRRCQRTEAPALERHRRQRAALAATPMLLPESAPDKIDRGRCPRSAPRAAPQPGHDPVPRRGGRCRPLMATPSPRSAALRDREGRQQAGIDVEDTLRKSAGSAPRQQVACWPAGVPDRPAAPAAPATIFTSCASRLGSPR